ncbi:MAG: DUF3794 domain-containing protein [Clostridia bacterium]|nr:DUF3794 domain-containing protein [Clostridia bacterium]
MMEKQVEQSIDILREELPLQRFVGECISQAVVEGEVALPGGLREETRVLTGEAMVVAERAAVENGRVLVDGKTAFHILYTQGDPTKVSALEASADFSHTADIPGALAGMTAPVSLMVEHVEASAQGGRLHLMAVVRVHARVFTDEPISVVTGVRGAEGLMTHAETLRSIRTVGYGAQDVLIRDECELGSALQITDTLYATATAAVQDVMGGEGRATLSGTIQLEATHLSDMPSRPVVITRHSIPFEETVVVSGENGDELCCRAVVRDVAVISQEGTQEGERTLRAEVLLGLRAESTRTRDACLLLDAYTTQGDVLALDKQDVRRAIARRQLHTAESGKLTLVLDGQPPVRTPVKATLRPVMTELSRAGGRLTVEGMMEASLLYMTDDDPAPKVYLTEEPFRAVFACDPSLPESLTLTAASVDPVTITSDRVEIKYILHLDCYDVQLSSVPFITQVTAQPAPPDEPGILMCFSQPGETVWELAKRYRVNPDSLRSMNPDLKDSSAGGQRVILWKR